jgi:hypothetical protein
LTARNVRDVKIDNGTIGAAELRSTTTNAASIASPDTALPSTTGDSPCSGAAIRA